jgi:hypothetical protein
MCLSFHYRAICPHPSLARSATLCSTTCAMGTTPFKMQEPTTVRGQFHYWLLTAKSDGSKLQQ